MKIQRITLSEYKRFALGSIVFFDMQVDSPLQLILGTNGSGKSSLLAELTPLPAIPSDYRKGGYKEIALTFKSNSYLLRSDISRGAKHSFIKEGIELNPGGTGVVQKELVEQELGFTTQLKEVLTGKLRFTQMAPTRRREWITRLCSTDLSFANKVYDQVKVNSRDTQGALKHIKERLATQTVKLMDVDTVVGIRSRVDKCHKQIAVLLEARDSNMPPYTETGKRVWALMAELERLAKRTLTLSNSEWFKKGYTHPDQFDEQLNNLSVQAGKMSASIESKEEELMSIAQIVSSMQEMGAASVGELTQRRDKCLVSQSEIVLSSQYDLSEVDTEPMLRDIKSVYVPLRDWCVEVPTDIKPAVDREGYQINAEKIKQYKEELNRIHNRMDKLRHRVTHIETARESKCPKCSYIWRDGVSDTDHEQCKLQLNVLAKEEEAIQNSVKVLEELNDSFDNYRNTLRQLNNIVQNYPRLQPFWSKVIELKYYDTNPTLIVEQFSTFTHAVESQDTYNALQNQIAQLNASLEQITRSRPNGDTSFESRMAQLEIDLDSLHKRHSTAKDEHKALLVGKQEVVNYFNGVIECDNKLKEVTRLQSLLFDGFQQKFIGEALEDRQLELSTLQSTLNQKNTLEGIIRDLKTSHEEVELDSQAWQVLAQVLSPTTGIIAEQLEGFMRCLLEQMNAIIAKLWTYSLEIMPCANEAGTLDYKFPINVKHGEQLTKDIMEGSEGQQEVIDFAFMITVMHYMDLHDYPMYLDETGAKFDGQHRERLMNYIKLLVDTEQASQLFLVNHYASFSGGLSNAQVCVLDDSNVTLPSEYNTHVQIR